MRHASPFAWYTSNVKIRAHYYIVTVILSWIKNLIFGKDGKNSSFKKAVVSCFYNHLIFPQSLFQIFSNFFQS
jgi:hypothetical protein